MADKIFQRTDASGIVTIAVFRQQASAPSAHFFDHQVDVDSDMVAIGGGATGAENPAGALLTASFPNNNRSAWLVSSKDHSVSNPHRLTGFAIGMKIDGLSRDQLVQQHLRFTQQTSNRTAHPSTSAGVPAGFTMIGGGFRVNWPPGAGNLATASFPEFGDVWTARSKDHFIASPCTIDTFSVGLRTQLPLPVGKVDRVENSGVSGSAAHPSIAVRIADAFALTGIGAEARTTGPGSLLWRLEPTVNGNQQGVTAASKDHQASSPATIKAWAIGIRLI